MLLDRIALGEFSDRALDVDLVKEFHRTVLQSILPDIAGVHRPVDVAVGKHLPPPYYEVPVRMEILCANLAVQVESAGDDLERQIEALAYAEGEFLNIHPFRDFNGRAIRAFLTEILLRFDLPPVEVSVERNTVYFDQYTNALRAYDQGDPMPLRQFWVERFER